MNTRLHTAHTQGVLAASEEKPGDCQSTLTFREGRLTLGSHMTCQIFSSTSGASGLVPLFSTYEYVSPHSHTSRWVSATCGPLDSVSSSTYWLEAVPGLASNRFREPELAGLLRSTAFWSRSSAGPVSGRIPFRRMNMVRSAQHMKH